MTPADLRKCKDIVKKFMMKKGSYIFAEPVDPVRDNCPGYLEIIQNPMDLGTVREKLLENKYPDFLKRMEEGYWDDEDVETLKSALAEMQR